MAESPEQQDGPPLDPRPAKSSAPSPSVADIAYPWFSYTVAQAEELRRTVSESTDNVLQSARSHLVDLQSASSHHFSYIQNILKNVQSEYGYYEDIFFGKIKEGLHVAGEHPGISYTALAGFGLLAMRRPRRFLFRHTIGRFQNEEALLTNYENKVREMRQSVDMLKNESRKLEQRAKLAEDELQRGQTKLKQVGGQLQNLVTSICKTEGRAQSLMEGLRELPGRDALKFRAEVASMVAEAKQDRTTLSKKITKIANYGIPV